MPDLSVYILCFVITTFCSTKIYPKKKDRTTMVTGFWL